MRVRVGRDGKYNVKENLNTMGENADMQSVTKRISDWADLPPGIFSRGEKELG